MAPRPPDEIARGIAPCTECGNDVRGVNRARTSWFGATPERTWEWTPCICGGKPTLLQRRLAAAILAERAEADRLRAALLPFARRLPLQIEDEERVDLTVTARVIRAARAALAAVA